MSHYLVINTESNWAYSIELQSGRTYRMGRAENNDIMLKDAWISSYHARLSVDEDGITITDLDSRNGIRLNGEKTPSAHLINKDRVSIGDTEILYVTQLDPLTIGSQAYLSPKLSEAFMKTEVQKIASVTRSLTMVRDGLQVPRAGANGAQEIMRQGSTQLDLAIDRLRDIEDQVRVLVATNHFHEIFHSGTDLVETLSAALRFITTAIEADNGALVLYRNRRWLPQALCGKGVEAWESGVPRQFASLLGMIDSDSTSAHLPDVSHSAVAMRLEHGELFIDDHRSVLVVGFRDSKGELAGAGYFDNVNHPEWLRPESAGLVAKCLDVVARYVLPGDSIFGTQIGQPSGQVGGRLRQPTPVEHTRFL